MSDKITVEEMVNHLIRLNRLAGWTERCPTCEAIREALTEKPKVSRARIMEVFCNHAKEIMAKNLCGFPTDLFVVANHKQFINILTELDIEVGDNSEVRRRTSDKEGV